MVTGVVWDILLRGQNPKAICPIQPQRPCVKQFITCGAPPTVVGPVTVAHQCPQLDSNMCADKGVLGSSQLWDLAVAGTMLLKPPQLLVWGTQHYSNGAAASAPP